MPQQVFMSVHTPAVLVPGDNNHGVVGDLRDGTVHPVDALNNLDNNGKKTIHTAGELAMNLKALIDFEHLDLIDIIENESVTK